MCHNMTTVHTFTRLSTRYFFDRRSLSLATVLFFNSVSLTISVHYLAHVCSHVFRLQFSSSRMAFFYDIFR